MQKLKINDEVIVLTGKDKGKTGKVVKLNFKTNRVMVSKVNMVKKTRKRGSQEASDFVEVEHPIHISNVALVSPKTKKASRVRIETREGKKMRVAVACGSVME